MEMLAYIIVGALILYLATTLVKPTKQESAKPQQFETTTAEIGRELPVLFGTRWLKSGNIVWWGDLKVTPIKVKTGK